ncbi:prephenate dehydrogenase/arogenate dehydrogenase family protein [Brachyspira aalborgi]|uniref:Prephenate dehydrogenase/arogenate dehydrogenase family protein n=1 Tax=Brachyspira aalborgi TaxID=29522 RepID=A0A5C8DC68_9SPIR|nr:prephenate dehydrogenase/arogenate dehydrogenase family protein [Brachyspira aalborgi]TXJ21562.1 prephenate dehydrogenase/arogenate dehydrogenase family protein [Brachyspira aalborgi]
MKLGFIGLGIMGLPMALNLLNKSGKEVIGFDISKERNKLFSDKGGIIAADIKEISNSCDIIFISLAGNELVKKILSEIIDNSKENTIIVDTSSTSPLVIKEIYEKAKFKKIALIDAPVSGGDVGAIEGKLVIMAGGDKEIFDKVEPFLLYMGSKATYMGASGNGQIAKLANNIIAGCNIAVVAEGLAFASKAGIDTTTLFNAIKDGAAGSYMLNIKAPKMIAHDFTANARMAVHQKDLKNASELAKSMGVEIPISKITLGYWNEMEKKGCSEEDHCCLSKIYEERMNTRI